MGNNKFTDDRILEITVTVFSAMVIIFLFLKILFF